jgi:hypothetical protein
MPCLAPESCPAIIQRRFGIGIGIATVNRIRIPIHITACPAVPLPSRRAACLSSAFSPQPCNEASASA